MSGIKLLFIFLAALAIDGLVLPALFGFRNGLLSILVLIISVSYLGPERRYIVYGFFFAIISESFRGLNFGALSVPFLLTVVVIYLAQNFLDIKYTHGMRFSLNKSIFVAFMSAVFIYMFSFFYGLNGASAHFLNLAMGLNIILEALVLVFVFNFMFNKKSDYKI